MIDAVWYDGVRYLSTDEAAERSKVTDHYVSLLARQSKLRAKRIGRKWYVDPASLDRFLAEQAALKNKRSANLSDELRAVAERMALSSPIETRRATIATANQ